MIVFFDASVIISGILSQSGASSALLSCVKERKINSVTSQTVVDEIIDQDKTVKLGKSKEELQMFIAESGLLIFERITKEAAIFFEKTIDKKDAHLIAGATQTGCTHLVSLDKRHVTTPNVQKHYLPLKIVSPKELLREIQKAHLTTKK